MKILHLCLANFYIDNYSYQENILPKYHKKLGHDVEIIASLLSFDDSGQPSYLPEPRSYPNEYGIPVTRLGYKYGRLGKRFRIYSGTYGMIEKSKPDVIFIHGCQFMDIESVVRYAQKNTDVKIYVDNHADFSNSARTFLSKNILHKLIWKRCAKKVEPFTTKFYGVLPARVDFLINVYNIPKDKVELLVMGADDEHVEYSKSESSISVIREKHKIDKDDFLIVTGGKIDEAKRQTLLLMEAVNEMRDNNVKLIIFGSLSKTIEEEFYSLVDNNKITYVGWLSSEMSYRYFGAADLVVFPGRHSVYWEQVVGIGIPMIVKYWDGTDHVDIGGNCLFLHEDSKDLIKLEIESLLNNPKRYDEMKQIASKKGMEVFSYERIAEKSLGLNDY